MSAAEAILGPLQARGLRTLYPDRVKIAVGRATCGLAAGADSVYRFLLEEVERRQLDVQIAATGCLGWCQQEPLVTVQAPGRPRLVYGRVDEELAAQILDGATSPDGAGNPDGADTGRRGHQSDGRPDPCPESAGDLAPGWRGSFPGRRLVGTVCADEVLLTGQRVLLTDEGESGPALDKVPFYAPQLKIATRNCGYIDPASIAEYAARGGYLALEKALGMEPAGIIAEITASGLRGRGGGGYPTGRKWQSARQQPGDVKYIICNADEGDPGAYMDRSVLESDPHTVLEGMIIGGYAIGARSGIVYVRSEYPLAVARLQEAIAQAAETGMLGENIFGSGFDFQVEIVRGQGAFVCGEETALIASIEGRMGEPHPRPPYPSEAGLWGKPTCINNVETWANVPPIIMRGSGWFAGIGTESSKGTKVFALVGNIRNNGLVEVPMGATLRQAVMEAGGDTGRFGLKAVQTGGPSGGCIPASQIDLPVDYEALTGAGSIMGSGGLVVMDERTCMVDVARFFLSFTQEESCGKCLACREGTWQMLQILDRITAGKAVMEDLELLEQLARAVRDASLCGLGQTAPSPVLSSLRHFLDEYEAHIRDHFCPAGVCKGLFRLVIDQDACTGCGRCVEVCPAEAVGAGASGAGREDRQAHLINQERCVQCRSCLDACTYRAVRVVPKEADADADHR